MTDIYKEGVVGQLLPLIVKNLSALLLPNDADTYKKYISMNIGGVTEAELLQYYIKRLMILARDNLKNSGVFNIALIYNRPTDIFCLKIGLKNKELDLSHKIKGDYLDVNNFIQIMYCLEDSTVFEDNFPIELPYMSIATPSIYVKMLLELDIFLNTQKIKEMIKILLVGWNAKSSNHSLYEDNKRLCVAFENSDGNTLIEERFNSDFFSDFRFHLGGWKVDVSLEAKLESLLIMDGTNVLNNEKKIIKI